jgi:hypothetical protein
MHAYITDSAERRDVPLILAAVAIAFSLGLSSLLDYFKVSIPAWVDITSVPLLYGILYALFDKYCWRWWIFRRTDIVKVPMLGGVWRGYSQSSFDEFQTSHQIEMRIEQRWTAIRITFRGDLSGSHSILAAIFVDAPDGVVLDYEYQNEPLPGAREAMQIHHGTARLRVIAETEMEGYYYTGRGRSNHGSIQLTRIQFSEAGEI